MPSRSTTRRITSNLKTINTQNCQKIKLYFGLTTKDLKKPYSPRWVGGAEIGRQCGAGEAVAAVEEWVVPDSHVVDKNQEAYRGSK